MGWRPRGGRPQVVLLYCFIVLRSWSWVFPTLEHLCCRYILSLPSSLYQQPGDRSRRRGRSESPSHLTTRVGLGKDLHVPSLCGTRDFRCLNRCERRGSLYGSGGSWYGTHDAAISRYRFSWLDSDGGLHCGVSDMCLSCEYPQTLTASNHDGLGGCALLHIGCVLVRIGADVPLQCTCYRTSGSNNQAYTLYRDIIRI